MIAGRRAWFSRAMAALTASSGGAMACDDRRPLGDPVERLKQHLLKQGHIRIEALAVAS